MPIAFIAAIVLGLVAVGASAASAGIGPRTRRTRLKTGTISSKIATFHLVRGTVTNTPIQIAQQIERKTGRSYVLPVIALGTMIASEASSGSRMAKIGVAWAAKNAARRKGISLYKLLAPRGRFGAQGVAGRGYAATARPPNLGDLQLAADVYTGAVRDPTKGSLYFDSPQAFARLIATEGYGKTAAEVAAKRRRSGLSQFNIPGINPRYLRFWRYA